MPKYSDYAALSSYVYHDAGSPSKPPVGWQQPDGFNCPRSLCPDPNYHAEVFVNTDAKEIIVAFRGTTTLSEIIDEDLIEIWLLETTPSYYENDVIPHLRLIKQKIDAHPQWNNYKVTFTGHSLVKPGKSFFQRFK